MEGEKSKIGPVTAVALVVISVIIDLIILLFSFIPIIGWVFNLFITLLAYLLFYLWFKLIGINFFEGKKSVKKVMSMVVGAVGGSIPFIGALAWTVAVLGIIIITWGEEKAAKILASDSKLGKIARETVERAQKNLGQASKIGSEKEKGDIAFAQKEISKITDKAKKIRQLRELKKSEAMIEPDNEEEAQANGEEEKGIRIAIAREQAELDEAEYQKQGIIQDTGNIEDELDMLNNKPDRTATENALLVQAQRIMRSGVISPADRNNKVLLAAYKKNQKGVREYNPNTLQGYRFSGKSVLDKPSVAQKTNKIANVDDEPEYKSDKIPEIKGYRRYIRQPDMRDTETKYQDAKSGLDEDFETTYSTKETSGQNNTASPYSVDKLKKSSEKERDKFKKYGLE